MTRSFALRVDIDTVRGLVDGVPAVLEICEDLGIKATFFATVGKDTAAQALLYAPRFARHLAINPIEKYGLRELIGSLVGRRFAPHAEKIRAIEAKGHEVQLHCYDHLQWVKKVGSAEPFKVLSMIAQGVEAFRKIMGRSPEGFASPSFRVTDAVLGAEEKLGFRYASDYEMQGECVPFKTHGRSVLQIPVNAPLIEDLVAQGMPDDLILSAIVETVSKNSLTVMYIHACYEPLAKSLLLRSILEKVLDLADDVTFTEIWRAWNR